MKKTIRALVVVLVGILAVIVYQDHRRDLERFMSSRRSAPSRVADEEVALYEPTDSEVAQMFLALDSRDTARMHMAARVLKRWRMDTQLIERVKVGLEKALLRLTELDRTGQEIVIEAALFLKIHGDEETLKVMDAVRRKKVTALVWHVDELGIPAREPSPQTRFRFELDAAESAIRLREEKAKLLKELARFRSDTARIEFLVAEAFVKYPGVEATAAFARAQTAMAILQDEVTIRFYPDLIGYILDKCLTVPNYKQRNMAYFIKRLSQDYFDNEKSVRHMMSVAKLLSADSISVSTAQLGRELHDYISHTSRVEGL